MSLELVPAVEADRAFYRHVHHVAYRADIEKMFVWDEEQQNNFADKDFNERNPTVIYWNGKGVGVAGWQHKPDYILFGPIFILPEFQGQNIGSEVLKKFINKADVQSTPLRLRTLIVNQKAKAWYERFGFKVIGESAIHWDMEYLP